MWDSREDVVNRANEFFGKDPPIASVKELLRLFVAFRKESHPDRFSDETAKESATERFKTAGTLMDQLKGIQEVALASLPPVELLSQARDDSAICQQLELDLDKANETVYDLRQKLKSVTQRAIDTEEALHRERNAQRAEQSLRIERAYAPAVSTLAYRTAAVIVAAALAVLTQIEQIAAHLERIWPGSPSWMRAILYCICLLILLKTGIQVLRDVEFRSMRGDICTTAFVRKFWREQLGVKHESVYSPRREFNEEEIADFLSLTIAPRKAGAETYPPKRLSSILTWFHSPRRALRQILGLYGDETVDRLKEALVNWMFQRQLADNTRRSGLLCWYTETHDQRDT